MELKKERNHQIKVKENKKFQKGITLVALVITIVVLLILAGITISLLITEDGIITRAQKAQEAQEIGELKDRLGVQILDWSTEKILTQKQQLIHCGMGLLKMILLM